MTPEEFTRQLPPFANDMARSKPPFVFKNLSVRVFPLRASLDALQQVCNGYLNLVPPEVGRFRAVVPYAYLALLDYGQISEMESSVGWFAQSEVYFGVPVEWYQVVDGRWVFRDWAVITPFIYVDDDFSVPLGRMVFGFPKTLAHVTKSASEWLRDPIAPVTLARVETVVFPELYKGRRLETRVFLEVERDAPMSNFRIPADLMSPIAPWVIASKLAEVMAGFGRDAMSIAQSMRIFEPNPGINPAFGAEMLNRVMPAFMSGGKGLTLNSLNLKQFRSSDDPLRFCYQALTNGRMQMTGFNGAGFLGEERTVLGDLTGGYTIKLHEYSSLLVARTLGLEVHRRWRGDGVDVVSLKPVMPFWASLNVKYLAGTNLAWRSHGGIWHGGNGQPLVPPHQKAATEGSNSTLFNTTVTSAVDDAIAGPFEFTGTTIRVLPLLADRAKLKEFLDRSINDALCDPGSSKHYRLSVWSRPPVRNGEPTDGRRGEKHGLADIPEDGRYAYVYMTATSFGGVTSKTNNVGDWAKYELSFLIPVKWEREVAGKFEVEGVGLVPAYSFVDSSTAAVSRTEVLGIPTLRAEFVRPQSVWLQEGEANFGARQTLLRVDTEVFTALHAGQQASMNPLIEISSRDFAGIGEPDSRANPTEWAEILRSELESKKATRKAAQKKARIARALALELLGNQVPVSLYTLKQFRDVADPGKACYQSLVKVPRVFDEVFDVREIEETIRVRIHEFPTHKLVENLGIVAKTVREDEAGIVYGTQAIRPFYIRATITEDAGERLLSRAGAPEWELGEHVDSLLSDRGRRQIEVDLQAARVQDQGDPSHMKPIVQQAIQRRLESEFEFAQKEDLQKLHHLNLRFRNAPDAKTQAQIRALKEKLKSETKALKQVLAERMTKKDARKAALTREEGTRLQELSRKSTKDEPTEELTKEEREELKALERRKAVLEEAREGWRRRIEKPAARDALHTIDPQMVIESILSREWGNFDENARWRRGRQDLIKALTIMLPGGPIPFAKFRLDQTTNTNQQIKDAIKDAQEDFANVEASFHRSIRQDKANRPGRPPMGAEVEDMIARMKEFTLLRLKLDLHFYVLTAGYVHFEGLQHFDKLNEAVSELVKAMKAIAEKQVIGEPSQDDNVDRQVVAHAERLRELLDVFDQVRARWASDDVDGFRLDITKGLKTQIDRVLDLDERATGDALQLIDQFREAVQLAGKCCNVQREALLNKLSRAYQKPDFCIRRDSVGSARDQLLPMTLSWDEDWYHGTTLPDDDEDRDRNRKGPVLHGSEPVPTVPMVGASKQRIRRARRSRGVNS